MNIKEIRKNKPDGATHYREWKWGEVDYIRMLSEGVYDVWYNHAWIALPYDYFSRPLKIKPL